MEWIKILLNKGDAVGRGIMNEVDSKRKCLIFTGLHLHHNSILTGNSAYLRGLPDNHSIMEISKSIGSDNAFLSVSIRVHPWQIIVFASAKIRVPLFFYHLEPTQSNSPSSFSPIVSVIGHLLSHDRTYSNIPA